MKRELVSQNVHEAHFNGMKPIMFLVVVAEYKYLWNTIIIHYIIVNNMILSTST